MKKLLSFTPIAFTLFLFQFGASSCTKEIIKETIKLDTVTLIRKDTIVIKDTAITLQLLTANSWKVQEMLGVTNNTVHYYKRGGTTNTENFDNEYITFNANKTGIFYDHPGYTHQMTWDFSNSENTKITLVVQNPYPYAPQTYVYENLRYKNGALYFDQYWTYNGVNHHSQCIRIPK